MSASMISFTFRCPRTTLLVQGWAPQRTGSETYYEPVECTACKGVHLVDTATGNVMGFKSEK